jgi:hypothetical protein
MFFPCTRSILCTILLTWLTAYAITLVLIDQDAYSQGCLVVTVQSLLQQALQEPVSITFDNLRLALGRTSIKNMHVVALDRSWSWHTNTLELHFSLWNMLRERQLQVTAKLINSSMFSSITNKEIAISSAIRRLFSVGNAGKVITVNHVTIINNEMTFIYPSGTIYSNMSASLPLTGRYRNSYIWWQNGTIHYNDLQLIGNYQGSYIYDHDQKTTRITHEAAVLPSHATTSQVLQGTISHEKGVWNLQASSLGSDNDEVLQAKANIDQNNQLNVLCSIPIPWLFSFYTQQSATLRGTIDMQFDGNTTDVLTTGTAHIAIENGTLHHNDLPKCTATITNMQDKPFVLIECPTWGAIEAQLQVKKDGCQVHIQTSNDNIIASSCCLKSGSSLDITIDTQGAYHGSYTLDWTQSDKVLPHCMGTFHGSLKEIAITGALGTYNFTCAGSSQGDPHITQATLHEHNNPLLQLYEENGLLKGSLDVKLLSILFEQSHAPIMLGEGLCTFEGMISTRMFDGVVKLASGSTIRIPYLYNILEELSMRFQVNWQQKTFIINDMILYLHQGKIQISKAEGTWQGNALRSLTVPYLAQNCLISWRKDLFALLSGAGMLSYTPAKSLAKGFLIVEKGHIRNNILSPRFPSSNVTDKSQQDTLPTINLDMHLFTRKPIQVKTSFLEARVGSAIQIQGTVARPSIKGSATLIEGTLLFPYKPLFIRQGLVTLHSSPVEATAHRLSSALAYGNFGYEPHVNLIAENTIKGYRIRMHVQGLLQNPDLTFSSAPHLPTEQIIALLFGGSEDGSIYVAMSSYIMQSIKDLLFGPPDGTLTTLELLKNLFRPLGSVRFVPSFTDQSSRGGIRGSLAIEVNERLRGIIKQNFDLPQDVMLEVEYDLSDDARIRAIKDERGDLGAEIEASWKF